MQQANESGAQVQSEECAQQDATQVQNEEYEKQGTAGNCQCLNSRQKMAFWMMSRNVPEQYRTPITGGNMNGMTSINTTWRMMMLTELFGPVGIGWKYDINSVEFLNYENAGATGQVSPGEELIVMQVSVSYKTKDGWSEPLPGIGTKKQRVFYSKGPAVIEDAIKMAFSDGFGVACKALGVGADIYMNEPNRPGLTKEQSDVFQKSLEDTSLTMGWNKKQKMAYWNMGKTVPQQYQKKITGGNMNGMTNIDPVWRMMKLTEMFGPVGCGWRYSIENLRYFDYPVIGEGGVVLPGEQLVMALVALTYHTKNGWTEPVRAYGTKKIRTQEKNGWVVKEEAPKMAVTDALGTAMKALGVGADIYLNEDQGGKYSHDTQYSN